MDKNYIELYSKDGKEGVNIKGQDVILLDAPEVRLSPDTPLLTNAQDVAGAINELFQLDPGGGDIWKPPSHWPQIPEPADNQAIFYVEVDNPTPSIVIAVFEDGSYGNAVIDWGDGYVDNIPDGNSGGYIHPYTAAGKYIITVTCNGAPSIDINYTRYSYVNGNPSSDTLKNYQRSLKAIKMGKNIKFYSRPDTSDSMYGMTLIYMKFLGEIQWVFHDLKGLQKIEAASLPDTFGDTETYAPTVFRNCYSLHDVDFLKDFRGNITQSTFENCKSLTSINLPYVTSVDVGAFRDCSSLRELILPSVTSIGFAFDYCYNLRKIVVSDNCEYYSSSLDNCPAIYPKVLPTE